MEAVVVLEQEKGGGSRVQTKRETQAVFGGKKFLFFVAHLHLTLLKLIEAQIAVAQAEITQYGRCEILLSLPHIRTLQHLQSKLRAKAFETQSKAISAN